MDYENFLSKNRAILDAPAGYGKTYAIVECLKSGSGKKLILTHTHAGVASLKGKLKVARIDPTRYKIETIDSFALRIFKSYTSIDEQRILEQEPNDIWKNDGKHIKELASILLSQSLPVKAVLGASYTGVFIDEYQDCSRSANLIANSLSEIFPVHIFVDWMQAIFNFNPEDPLVTFSELHNDFKENIFNLDTPWRWANANKALGEDLKEIRTELIDGRMADLSECKNIEFVNSEKDLYALCFQLLKEHEKESILIIHPNKRTCRGIAQKLSYSFQVLESIDDKDFYKVASAFDVLSDSPVNASVLFNTLSLVFLKTSIDVFYKSDHFVKKAKEPERVISQQLQGYVELLTESFSFKTTAELLKFLQKSGLKIKDNRIELFRYLIVSLEVATSKNISVHKAMQKLRDSLRHQGRSPYLRSIDTTLLTKGLEFDVVVVTDADNIGSGYGKYSMENWYVALSRAMKRLVIHSSGKVFDFN